MTFGHNQTPAIAYRMFDAGFDTLDIARRLKISHAEAEQAVHQGREADRTERAEWAKNGSRARSIGVLATEILHTITFGETNR